MFFFTVKFTKDAQGSQGLMLNFNIPSVLCENPCAPSGEGIKLINLKNINEPIPKTDDFHKKNLF